DLALAVLLGVLGQQAQLGRRRRDEFPKGDPLGLVRHALERAADEDVANLRLPRTVRPGRFLALAHDERAYAPAAALCAWSAESGTTPGGPRRTVDPTTASALGRRTSATVPPPSRGRSDTQPCWRSTIRRTRYRPSPTPVRGSLSGARQNRSKARSTYAGSIPTPRSQTRRYTVCVSEPAWISTAEVGATSGAVGLPVVCRTALLTSSARIGPTMAGSPYAGGSRIGRSSCTAARRSAGRTRTAWPIASSESNGTTRTSRPAAPSPTDAPSMRSTRRASWSARWEMTWMPPRR